MAHVLMVESWTGTSGEALPGVLHRLGHRFTLLTRDPAAYPDYADGTPHPVVAGAEAVIIGDTNDVATAVRAAAAAHRSQPFDGVLTTCDYYLAVAAEVAAALGRPGPDPAVVAVATRKDRVRRALSGAGVPNPRFAAESDWPRLRAAATTLGYPLVAKPVDLHSSTLVRRVDDEAALRAVFDEVRALTRNSRGQALARVVLLEEVLTGAEVSVEAVTVAGHTTVLGITDKSVVGAPSFVESGHQFPAPLAPATAAAVQALVVDALAAVGWTHGVSHTEVMLTPAGPRIVELNPRQGGNHIFDLVELVTGTNVLAALVAAAVGAPPIPAPPNRGASDRSRAASAAVAFVMAPRAGQVVEIGGRDRVVRDPHVVRLHLPILAGGAARRGGLDAARRGGHDAGRMVRPPRDNEDYLGHVIAVDPTGADARGRAEAAVATLRLRYADGAVVPALAVRAGPVTGCAEPPRSAEPPGVAVAGRTRAGG